MVGGDDATSSVADSMPITAVSVAVEVPSGGVSVTWSPLGDDSAPAVAFQVTVSAALSDSPLDVCTLNTVGPVIATLPAVPAGTIVRVGRPSVDEQPQSNARYSHAAATIVTRIEVSQANKVKIAPPSHANARVRRQDLIPLPK
jgi:hypothetical protein